jgi:TonB-linked SusC/RagA family outer membrane protein
MKKFIEEYFYVCDKRYTVTNEPERAILWRRMLKAMKITTALILIAALHVSASGIAQTISFSGDNVPLAKVFNAIEDQLGFGVLMPHKLMESAKLVTVKVKDGTLDEVLQKCFKFQPWKLAYTITGHTIYIFKTQLSLTQPQVASAPIGNNVNVSGTVYNIAGQPLAGATVTVKKSKKGTLTNVKGEFNLGSIPVNSPVFISFIGYATQQVLIKDASPLQIVLHVAVSELDEVVTQAYGKTSQRLTTSDIGVVTAEEIEKQPVMNPLLALQGKVAGLDIVQTSGYASAPVKVELRGRSAINSIFTSDPLYIIDGVPLTVLEIGQESSYQTGSTGFIQTGSQFNGPADGQSPLFSINSADIESIEVLKDADATAIYGSRGANGVILITTKKGKAGKTKFDLHVQEGVDAVVRYWKLMNTAQYLAMRWEAFNNDAIYGITPNQGNAYDLLAWDTTKFTDWQKTLYGREGKTVDVQASLSGGNAQTTFRLGAGFDHTTNILSVSGGDQRGSLSFNIIHYSDDRRFNVSFTTGYTISQSNMIDLPGNVLMPPDAPGIYDSAGNLNYAGWGGATQNSQARAAYPFSSLQQPYTATTNFLNSNLVLNYEPFRGFKITSSLGYNSAQDNQKQFDYIASQDPETQPTGSSYFGYNTNKNWIIEPQITYESVIAKGKMNALVGSSMQETNTEGIFIGGSGYTSDNLIETISNAPSQFSRDISGEYRYAAAYCRLTYNWDNKYILNLNARRDGSSRFGPGKQYGDFGSIGVAWLFTEEKWAKDHLPAVSFGKLRLNYGTTGSDAVGDYQYLTRWTSSGTQPYDTTSSLIPTQHADPNFQWQVNKKLEGGINLGLFKGWTNIGVAFYRNRCGDQLVSLPTPAFSGFTSVTANSPALVQNSGWELTGNTKIISLKKFSWTINMNVAINRNKLLAYPDISQSPYASTLVVGQPLNIIHLLRSTGVDPQTGQYTFYDKNHDGQINYAPGQPTDDSYVYNLTPKFFGGLGMNFSYKNLSVTLFFYFKDQIGQNAILEGAYPGTLNNQSSSLAGKEWQYVGENATVARFTTNIQSSDYYFKNESNGAYTDASYVRLSNLSISYRLNSLKKMNLKDCNIFVHANNLFTITDYKGLDPETQNFGGMPPNRTVVGGISFDF